jgi:hypothetical protein
MPGDTMPEQLASFESHPATRTAYLNWDFMSTSWGFLINVIIVR